MHVNQYTNEVYQCLNQDRVLTVWNLKYTFYKNLIKAVNYTRKCVK